MTDYKHYDIFDLTKFILSIMIVAIHSSLFPEILYPWLRLAVPLFFVISSFLLFNRLNNCKSEMRKSVIRKFVVRQLELYFFWFIVLLPFTIYIRLEWFEGGILNGLYIFIKNLLFSSTFIASWFINASILGTLIIVYLSQKINYKILLFFLLMINVICCFVSSYYTFFINNQFIMKICDIYSIIFPSPVFSFPVSLLWIFIGKLFADSVFKCDLNNIFIYFLLLFFSLLLLFIESKYVFLLNNIYGSDCYIFLIPSVILIFRGLLNVDIKNKFSSILRKISTISFPLHAFVISIVRKILSLFLVSNSLLSLFSFIITLIIVYIICFFIFKLEKNNYFKFLKYSH